MVISIFEEKFREGVKKGKVEGKIETILLILSDRFDGVSKRLEKKIQKITDIEKLNDLVKLAARCESIIELRENFAMDDFNRTRAIPELQDLLRCVRSFRLAKFIGSTVKNLKKLWIDRNGLLILLAIR